MCSVCNIACSQAMSAVAWSPSTARGPRYRRARRSSQRDVTRGHGGTACVTLVNTSVYLKPTKLFNVALDMLARLAPCLNLGVGELGHKDLLDTIGADNRRK